MVPADFLPFLSQKFLKLRNSHSLTRSGRETLPFPPPFPQEELDLAMADLKKYIQEFMQKFLGKVKVVRRVRNNPPKYVGLTGSLSKLLLDGVGQPVAS